MLESDLENVDREGGEEELAIADHDTGQDIAEL